MPALVTCAAIMAVRNEAPHIERALRTFIRQGIDVVVIDHASIDSTVDICSQYIGGGLLRIEHLPWEGVYDQTAQLAAKASIVRELHHDWIIHADADEWLQSIVTGETLREGITRVSSLGYNVINFDEFVFLPPPDETGDLHDYEKKLLHYYFFAPFEKRLMRVWKRSDGLSNLGSGGHTLTGGELNVAPDNFILRHYIALSQEHALQKYLGRTFSAVDLAKGWHANRVNLTARQLKFPSLRKLKQLEHWHSVDFDRGDPKRNHYWEW